MDFIYKMNQALDYIEENLAGEIDVAIAAKKACCSSFNFQRMFSFICDISLAEYIRRRRFTLAAQDLLNTDMKIIDIAMKYGYESPVSFSRAFSSIHGINPSEIRKHTVQIKSYPRISFKISVKGVEPMNYRIEDLESFRLVGFKEREYLEDNQNLKRIPKFWSEVSSSEKKDLLMQCNDNKKLCCLGVCANGDATSFDYYIATGSQKDIPEGMSELIVPANTYVIFECVGKMPNSIQSVWGRIFTEWFPTSNYEVLDAPQIEWYSADDMDSDTYRSEIWIPVQMKK